MSNTLDIGSLRNKLQFNDDEIWTRFSKRRIELIKTHKLDLKSPSEQISEITEVSRKLCLEFNQSVDHMPEFKMLLCYAIETCRKFNARNGVILVVNRDERNSDAMVPVSGLRPNLRPGQSVTPILGSTRSITTYNPVQLPGLVATTLESVPRSSSGHELSVSTEESSILNSHKENHNRSLHTDPRITLFLYSQMVHHQPSENEIFLGKSLLTTCIAIVLDRSFTTVSHDLSLYFRSKFTSTAYLANLGAMLFPSEGSRVSEEEFVNFLYGKIGGCLKVVRFEIISASLCEILYLEISRECSLKPFNQISFLV